MIAPLTTDNKLELDFKKKANLFNTFFASKCSPIKMIVLCKCQQILIQQLALMKLIPMMTIYLKCLDLNKAHVHEDWSVRMIGQSLDLNGQDNC